MADPGEQLTVEELVEIQKLLIAIEHQLTATKGVQQARWTLVRQVVNSACLALLTLRHDLNDEKTDQGPPFWLSCLLAVALTALPLTAISVAFFDVLALSVQRRLARAEFTMKQLQSTAKLKLQRAAHTVPVRRELSYRRQAGELRRMANEQAEKIKRTEEMVAKFSERYEPEVSNTLQNAAQDLSEWATKPLYAREQSAGKKQEKKDELKREEDVALVAIQNNLLDWVASYELVELKAEARFNEKLRALFDLATTTVKKKFREKIETYHDLLSEEERPKDRDEAKAKMEALFKEFAAESIEEEVLPKNLSRKDLFDVQLTIECLIWCATYDFSPHNVLVKNLVSGPYGNYYTSQYVLEEPRLPPGFWDKLTKRYIDPDTYLDESPKTFKEAGKRWGLPPELRLAFYFSDTLFHGLASENNAAIQRLKAVKAPPPIPRTDAAR